MTVNIKRKILMNELEALQAIENQWTELINNLIQEKEKTLKVLLEIRKEIFTLSQLKLTYPENGQIDTHLSEYDQILQTTRQMYDEINRQLLTLKEEKETLEKTIDEYQEKLASLLPSNRQP
jgi:Mg2+ and Co2+ transporter CorA